MYFDLEATQGAVEVFIGCFIAVEVISSITSFFLKQINREYLKMHLYFWKNNEFINKTGKISSLFNESSKSNMAASMIRCACSRGKDLIRSNIQETYCRQKVAHIYVETHVSLILCFMDILAFCFFSPYVHPKDISYSDLDQTGVELHSCVGKFIWAKMLVKF